MLRETTILPGATSQTAHASVSMLKVNESTIRRRLGAGENLFFYKRQRSLVVNQKTSGTVFFEHMRPTFEMFGYRGKFDKDKHVRTNT